MLKIQLKSQVNVEVVNGEFIIPESKGLVSVFACTDGISCHIATVDSVEELDKVISPEHIMENIREQASEDEIDTLEGVMFARDYKYLSYDGKTILTAVK